MRKKNRISSALPIMSGISYKLLDALKYKEMSLGPEGNTSRKFLRTLLMTGDTSLHSVGGHVACANDCNQWK